MLGLTSNCLATLRTLEAFSPAEQAQSGEADSKQRQRRRKWGPLRFPIHLGQALHPFYGHSLSGFRFLTLLIGLWALMIVWGRCRVE